MKYIITIGLTILLFALIIGIVKAPNDTYTYYCIQGISYENRTVTGVNTITSITCQYDCTNDTGINFYQNREPQGDLCQKSPDFWINFLIIGGVLIAWLVLAIFYIILNRLPFEIRGFLWFFIFIGSVMLLVNLNYPAYFTTAQTTIFEISTFLTMIIIAVLGIFSVVKEFR